MLFAELVATVEAVTATRSRLAKVDALASLLATLPPDEVAPAIGFLTAQPRQGRLGVGWRTLTSIGQAPASGLPTERSTRHSTEPSLTISDIDQAFDALAATSGAGSAESRGTALRALAARATAREWDLLQRIVLGELRTGALEGVLLDAIVRASGRGAASVRRAAMLSGDLGETALLALTGTSDDLDGVGLVVGRAVLPMLASTAPDVAGAVAQTGTSSVEYKLDGARIQVHRHGDVVRVFTRSLADITHRVPEIVDAARALRAESFILDGETLALDEDGGPRPFQDTMSRFGADVSTGSLLRPWFFDILHVDGRDLLDEPLHVRLDELDRVVGEAHVPRIVADEPAAAEEFARLALAAGHEGVMVKALDAPYAAGRRGKSWLKVKPVLTFDLVVLGVEWGSGRREGWLSNLHLGARDPDGDFGPPGGLVMVGKTFKGLTDEVLRWQTDHFSRIETRRTARTVFVEPTTVVEIAIDGVQRSTRYPGGVALRFARVKGYRPDKPAAEADTIDALRQLLRGQAADSA